MKTGRHEIYNDRDKEYKGNRTFENNERKFYQQTGGEYTEKNQQPEAKETRQFRRKLWRKK